MGLPYFYIIKHLPSGKYYAGCKINQKADSSNLMTFGGYQTTSKIVKKLIQEGGLEVFRVIRVKHFESSIQALKYETRFLLKVNAAKNPSFINRHNGGKNFVNKGGYNLSEATKKKMRKPKSQETKIKQSESLKQRSKKVYKKMVETRRGRYTDWHNEKMRNIISINNKARFKDKEKREAHSKIMKEYYEKHPISEETREKLKETNRGENNKMFGKKHSESTREKMKLAWIARKARKNSESN